MNYNLDVHTYAERTPERLCFVGVYAPMSRFSCYTNILSLQAMQGLRTFWQTSNRLGQTTISTGGGFSQPDGTRQRYPHVTVPLWRGGNNFDCRTNGQENHEIRAFFEQRLANPLPGDPENFELPNAFTVNPHLVLWRLQQHESQQAAQQGEPRKVPITVELSHHAESYHSATAVAGWQASWRVHATEMEATWVNESRKVCTAGALMWRRASGEMIAADDVDTYDGPTLCWHGSVLGTPCYAPYPGEQQKQPTGLSPSR